MKDRIKQKKQRFSDKTPKFKINKWTKLISFIASIGFISIAFFENSISSKKELIDNYNYQAEILNQNIRDSENDYDMAFQLKNHIQLLALLKADTIIINKQNEEFITLLQMAALGVSTNDENSSFRTEVNMPKEIEKLISLYESGLLTTVSKANQLIQYRDQISSEKNNLEKYKIWALYFFILLTIISFSIGILKKEKDNPEME